MRDVEIRVFRPELSRDDTLRDLVKPGPAQLGTVVQVRDHKREVLEAC